MKKIYGILIVLPLLLSQENPVTAQSLICSNDTTLCAGSVTLSANWTGPQQGNNPTQLSFSDDQYSGVIPIGFSFTYYGNAYTQCLISSNDYISFDISQPNGYSPWSIPGPVPSAACPMNAAMGPWQDLLPPSGGIIRYQLQGVAPNRIFVVEYCNVAMFSCTNLQFTNQIRLYEGTNVIETHIANKPICAAWNQGRAIHATHNMNGTIAHVVPGRNSPTQWTANSDGYRFTPNGNNAYIIAQIPYQPSVLGNVNQIQWTVLGSQAIVGTGPTLTVTPAQTTTYIASLTGQSCNSITYRDTVTVFIQPLPIQASNDTSVCQGGSVPLTVNGTFSNPQFSWAPAAGLSNANAQSPTATPSQTTTYTVTVVDGPCTVTDQVTITVNPLPNISVNPAAPYICPGSNTQLTAQGATNYSWSPGTALSTTTGATTTASPSSQITYTVTGTDNNGCVSTANVTVSLYAPAQVSVTPSAADVCLGQSAQLVASGAVSYQWSPAVGMSYNGGDTIVCQPNQTEIYQVIGTDANGCYDTTNVTVTVNPQPTVDFASNPVSGCTPPGVLATFSDQSAVTSGSITAWKWRFESNGTSVSAGPVVGFSQPGQYDVTLIVTTDQGCVDSLTKTDYIKVWPSPTAAFTFYPETTNTASPEVMFSNQSSSDVVTWDWDFGGFGTSGASDPIFAFENVGEYPIVLLVTNQYGCQDSAFGQVVIENISNIFIPNTFTPNGDEMNDYFFPVLSSYDNNYLEVHVFDRWGFRVFLGTDYNKPWDGTFNDSKCPVGVYAYRIIYKNENGDEFRYMGNINLVR